MSHTAIKFENISKQYRLGVVSTKTLSHDLNRWWQTTVLRKDDPYLKIGEINDRASKGSSDYVWALRDINFDVAQGDVLGIIGKNGAGKSTLLKILSKVTAPTTGAIKAQGRIASLLEVGTGFHSEMTGRENIYMNGAILGMTKAEISRKLDEIIDFAGVERYIDTPVKRYSSGMMVRLGFAVAAHLDPEILVVDEVLAVGDAEFQKKAIGKMQDVSHGEGRTVLFVSHNMASMKQLCKKGVLLENGTVSQMGKMQDVIDKYLAEKVIEIEDIVHNIIYDTNVLKIETFIINNQKNAVINVDKNGVVQLNICGSVNKKTKIGIEARLYDYDHILLGTFAPGLLGKDIKVFEQGKFELEEKICFPKNIAKGNYLLEISLCDPKTDRFATTELLKINFDGIDSTTGDVFDYRGYGLLIL